MSYIETLSSLGYTLTKPELFNGKFMGAVRTGNLIYTSGQVSRWGTIEIKGKVGGDVSLEQGCEAARLCALNCIQAVHALVGVERIVRVVKVLGMVNVAPGFDNTPGVIHGASDLFNSVFGEAGRHARSAVGMVIPLNYAVEVEAIFEVRD